VRVDEHTINLDESPVFYRSAEAPDVPVLYLHGIPTSSDDWIEFLARTGGIAPDLIGFGR
jgi:pimeloyl-ACP methyl ester carboxylesterase